MKPSDLRRDAYTWQKIADRCREKAREIDADARALPEGSPVRSLLRATAGQFSDSARMLATAATLLDGSADELEARNAT